MRSIPEIVAKIQRHEGQFGFTAEALLPFLPFDDARPFLNPEITADKWSTSPLSGDTARARMAQYMADYGWPKCEDHRALSAGRTVEKMAAWLWLLGDDDMVAFAEDEENYPRLGAPVLAAICRKYGFPIPHSDALARMIEGGPCFADCEECGG